MLPYVERFRPVFAHFGVDMIVPEVHERLSEEEILAYAGQFDAALCGDARYTERVRQACLPRLQVISKWGTGIDSIDQQAAARLGIQVRNTLTPSPCRYPTVYWGICWRLPAASRGWIKP
jgi:D-3-phosphoglycerate dehydrogenase